MEQLFRVNLDDAIQSAWIELTKLTKDRPRIEESLKGFDSYESFLTEQKMLLAGLIYAWRVQFYKQFIQDFDVIHVEQEIETEVHGAILQTRCDMVCKSRLDGSIYIPDWKCVKDARNWSSKFSMESQTWTQMYAISAQLNEPIAGAIYWAFLKGGRNADNTQSSNLIYGYRRELASGESQYESSYQRSKDWTRFAVWEEPSFGNTPLDRLKYWVNWLPSEVRAANFCQSPPVMLDEALARDFLRASANNAKAIREELGLESPNLDFFYRSPNSYLCGRCAWRGPCLEGQSITELKANKVIVPHVDHHKVDHHKKENI